MQIPEMNAEGKYSWKSEKAWNTYHQSKMLCINTNEGQCYRCTYFCTIHISYIYTFISAYEPENWGWKLCKWKFQPL